MLTRRDHRAIWLLAGGLVALATGGALGCRHRRGGPGQPDSGIPTGQSSGPSTQDGTVRGRLLDDNGGPVPDARVLAIPRSAASGAKARETASGLDGRFSLDALPVGAYRLFIEAAGFPPLEQLDVTALSRVAPAPSPAGDGELAIHMKGAGAVIVGRIAGAGGRGVAGARVLIAPDQGGPVRATTSREGGGFAIGGLGPGRYAIRASRDGQPLHASAAASELVRAIAAENPAAPRIVEIALGPAFLIRGRVTDDAGVPLPGGEIRAESAALPLGEDPVPVSGPADEQGTFQLGPVPPGQYRVSTTRAGYLLPHAALVEWTSPEPPPPPVEVELVRGATVTGKVLDPRGAPAARARVACIANGVADLAVAVGPLPLAAEAAALPARASRAIATNRTVVTDAAGRFSLDEVVPGAYRIEIVRSGAEPFRSEGLRLRPGEHRDLGALALRAGTVLEGRVVDESGVPVESARVSVTAAGDRRPRSDVLAVATDAGGRFSLTLAPGRYELAATALGRATSRTSVELGSPPAASPAVELRLTRADAVIEGLVRDPGGRPLARARVLAWPLLAAAPSTQGGSPAPLASAVADVGGHFMLRALPAGDLRLEVRHPDYPTTIWPVTGGQYAQLTVPVPGGVSGEVRAAVTGAPIPRAHVAALGPDGAQAATETSKDGSFRLLRLAPGPWRLTAKSGGSQTAERQVEVQPATELGEVSVRDVRLELDPH